MQAAYSRLEVRAVTLASCTRPCALCYVQVFAGSSTKTSPTSLAAWRLCLPLVCSLAAAGLYLSPGQEIQAKPGLRRQTSAGLRQSGIWQPSMPRISSGHAMHDMQHRRSMEMQQWRGQAVALPDTDGASSSAATSAAGSRPNAASSWRAQQLADQHLTVPHSGQLAMDCLGSDATHPTMHEVTQVVTSTHLLQFGALLGESSAELALSQSGMSGAVGHSQDSLLGSTDDVAGWEKGWEAVAAEACPRTGLHYWAWRRYLRKGLYVYRTRTVYEGCTPAQLVSFQLDGSYKSVWDDKCAVITVLHPPTQTTAADQVNRETKPLKKPSQPSTALCDANLQASCTAQQQRDGRGVACAALYSQAELEAACLGRSCFLYARSRFPAPMAQREYVYARRVWAKQDDGGAYIVSRATAHPALPAAGCRTVKVQDFVSGQAIRATASLCGSSQPASEVVSVYFEDSAVNSGLANLSIRKGLWPMAQKTQAALRLYLTSEPGCTAIARCSAALQAACCDHAARAEPSVEPGTKQPHLMEPVQPAAAQCSTPPSRHPSKSEKQVVSKACPKGPAGQQGPGAVKASRLPAHYLPYLRTAAAWCLGWPSAGAAAADLNPLLASLTLPMRSLLATVCQCFGAVGAGLSLLVQAGRQRLATCLWVLHQSLAGPQGRPRPQASSELDGGASVAGSEVGGVLPSSCSHISSHPLWPGGSGSKAGSGRGVRRWGRRMLTKLATVAVRAVGPPLVHHVLSRQNSMASEPAPSLPSTTHHRTAHHLLPSPTSRGRGVAKRAPQVGGQLAHWLVALPPVPAPLADAAVLQTGLRMPPVPASLARTSPTASAPPVYPDLLQHPELMQQHVGMQQLQAAHLARKAACTQAANGKPPLPRPAARHFAQCRVVVDGCALSYGSLVTDCRHISASSSEHSNLRALAVTHAAALAKAKTPTADSMPPRGKRKRPVSPAQSAAGASGSGQQGQGQGHAAKVVIGQRRQVIKAALRGLVEAARPDLSPAEVDAVVAEINKRMTMGSKQCVLAAVLCLAVLLQSSLAHILALKATWDQLWEEFLKPRWRRQRLGLNHAQDRVIEAFCKKVVNGMKWVSRQYFHQDRGVAVFLGAGNSSQGGWKAGAVLEGFYRVVQQSSRPSADPRPDRLSGRDMSAALNIRRCAVALGPRPTALCGREAAQPANTERARPGRDALPHITTRCCQRGKLACVQLSQRAFVPLTVTHVPFRRGAHSARTLGRSSARVHALFGFMGNATSAKGWKPSTGAEERKISKSGYDITPLTAEERAAAANPLPRMAQHVVLEHGTERPFSGTTVNGYKHDNKQRGTYVCALGDLPLFSSDTKFDSGTGWPSFFAPIDKEHVIEVVDNSIAFMPRTEVLCARSGAHLGHVFDDGEGAVGMSSADRKALLHERRRPEVHPRGSGDSKGVQAMIVMCDAVVLCFVVSHSGGALILASESVPAQASADTPQLLTIDCSSAAAWSAARQGSHIISRRVRTSSLSSTVSSMRTSKDAVPVSPLHCMYQCVAGLAHIRCCSPYASRPHSWQRLRHCV
ncbi:hypothetical protein QJQ45_015986 [Haematococcus lacustris]|nr:hypothetical protein QJQ45_015986 [Haematococcus lacustris]